jgi:Zn-finger nucleic acid-binding protein
MNCPNCAAALELLPGRTHLRCPYCTSLVFPVPLDEGVVPLNEPHPDKCPACRKGLVKAALDGATIGYCSSCRGMLLANDHFARVLARLRAEGPVRTLTPEPIDPRELRRARNCPRCRRRFDTHVYGGGNAVIDSCDRCRLVWLDAGELTMLGRFVPERASARQSVWDERSAAPLEEVLRPEN